MDWSSLLGNRYACISALLCLVVPAVMFSGCGRTTLTVTQNVTETDTETVTATHLETTSLIPSATQRVTVTKTPLSETGMVPGMLGQLEKVRTWDYWPLLTADDLSGYNKEDFSSIAVTVDTTRIAGKDYLLMALNPEVGKVQNSLLLIYDASDPSLPSLISVFSHPGGDGIECRVRDIAISDGIMHAALEDGAGVWMVDISNPASPADLGVVDFPITENLIVSAGCIYGINTESNEIVVGRISGSGVVEKLRRIALNPGYACFAVDENHLVVGNSGLVSIWDVSSPENINRLSGCILKLSGDLTYALEWYLGASRWQNWASIGNIQVSGDYAYVTFGAGQVRVIDISDPASPLEAAQLDVGDFAVSSTLEDSILWVISGNSETQGKELVAIDVSDPQKPIFSERIQTKGLFVLGGTSYAMDWMDWMPPYITGNIAYIAEPRCLEIFRVSPVGGVQ
jgi:hypothetical protein